ncbi:T9SS type A sorting domain-containing protein [Hymenobacter sp.]|jgi:hypothetical protein|uniref:T9SS type A sorting domain-containing protein n=1 Tax=Hymenobacter sp. TaxID=1898978 RepID=UPI002ED8E58B
MLLYVAAPAWAQHEADHWYFGDRTGFDFGQGSPVPVLDGQLTTSFASAVASEPATGQLLFYSNAERVWNRLHDLMPHGDGLRGNNYANQGALIVPVPGQAGRYYLFTLRQPVQDRACGLHYSMVDMERDAGRGDVVETEKNVPLAGGLTEKLTALPHANGRDYWVLVHVWGTAEFLVYPITAQGVGAPRRQAIGPTHPVQPADTVRGKGTAGFLRASPDGRRLAAAVAFGVEPFSLFDFDTATGTVSHYVNLGALQDGYGVCFSPDNTKLYVQNFTRLPDNSGYNVLSQYDLAAGTDAAVAASGRSVVAGNPATNVSATEGGGVFYALQNGPDGRMYGASAYSAAGAPPGENGLQTMFVLGRPNAAGFACELRAQRFAFGGRPVYGGLPNFLQNTFDGREPAVEAPICEPGPVSLYPNPCAEACYVRLASECGQPFTLTLYDALGRRVTQFARTGARDEPPFPVSSLAAGLYIAELRFSRQVFYEKLVKH